MMNRIDPSETRKVWNGLVDLWQNGRLKHTIYAREYIGLEDVVSAMKDLESRQV